MKKDVSKPKSIPEFIDYKKSSNSIEGVPFLELLLSSKSKSLNLHQILHSFGEITDLDLQVGCSLDSSLRNKIRKARKELNGKLSCKGRVIPFNYKGKYYVVIPSGNQQVGENKVQSLVLKVEEVK